MENKKLLPNLRLAAQKADIYSKVDGLSLQNLFYTYFEYFPNCLMFTGLMKKDGNYHFDTDKLYDYLRENLPEEEEVEMIKYIVKNLDDGKQMLSFCILLKKSHLFARLDESPSESYVLYDNEHEDDVNRFYELLFKYYVKEEAKENNFYTISSNKDGYHLIENPVRVMKGFSVSKQYNDDFAIQDEKIQKFVKEENTSGLVILHGTKGTGKTTYIRHLISTNPEKKFVFVPAGLIEILGQPSFQSFLLSLSNHIIILEDCENALRDRKVGSNASAVSLLLNMSDGLLSDGLGIKFICTFNEDIKDMDEAIMRKGRLISKYEFKGLNADKANVLLREVAFQKSGETNAFLIDGNNNVFKAAVTDEGVIEITESSKDDETFESFPHVEIPFLTKPTTLADVYNYDQESYSIERKRII